MFPYSGYMVLTLLPDRTTPDTVGVYAGFLASSFMVGRFITAYQWGRLADRYGRLLSLQTCLLGSAFFSILFGVSQSMFQALLWRFFLGMFNGLISLTKTMSNEVARGNEVWERRIMGLVVGMRSWGMLMAPAAGGFLAEPLAQYPQLAAWMQNEWLRSVLVIYPFLLPNLLVAVLCLLASASLYAFVEETLPEDHRDDIRNLPRHIQIAVSDRFGRCFRGIFGQRSSVEERRHLISGETREPKVHAASADAIPTASPWQNVLTRQHMIAHWLFSFVSTYVDEAFPLFCMSTIGGLALQEASIGQILSLAGFIFVILQYPSFSVLTHHCGLYPSLEIGCVFGTLLCAFIPFSLRFPSNGGATIFLSAVLGIVKVMHSLFYTSMAVAINKTVESRQRARMNSLILVGNSVSKALGPLIAGFYVSFSFSPHAIVPAEYGSLSIWLAVPLLGFVALIQIQRLHRQVRQKESIRDTMLIQI